MQEQALSACSTSSSAFMMIDDDGGPASGEKLQRALVCCGRDGGVGAFLTAHAPGHSAAGKALHADDSDVLSEGKTATPPSAAGSESSRKSHDADDDDDESESDSDDEEERRRAGGGEDREARREDVQRQAGTKQAGAEATDDDDDYYERLYRAKKLARSEITVRQWDRYRFCEVNLDDALGPVEDNCERISCNAVSPEEFRERFEVPCKPCVISGLLDRWPAYHKWTYESLSERFGSARLKCGEDDDGYKVKIRLDYFARYAKEQKDDSPLYVFDADFGDEGKPTIPLLEEYSVHHLPSVACVSLCLPPSLAPRPLESCPLVPK